MSVIPCDPRSLSPTRASSLTASNTPTDREEFDVFPENLKYTNEHEWVRTPGMPRARSG